jgi:PAS domain S-box-containing protein
MKDGRLSILLVDDDAAARERLAGLVAKAGYPTETTHAAAGREALALLRERRFDCLLVESELPDASGAEVVAQLRADGALAPPVIMVTGAGDELLAAQVMRAGAADYLPKSRLSADALGRAISEGVARWRAQGERDRAQAELAASEAHFRALVEDQSELVAVAQPDLTITYANHAFAAHHGLGAGEATGRNLLDFVAPEEREAVVDRMRRLCKRKSVERGETRSLAEGAGARRWVAWTHRAVVDRRGAVAAIHAVGRDIDDQVEAREDGARLAALVHGMADATVSSDMEGRITSWNPAAEHLFDLPARQALGKAIGLIIPPDRESEARTLFERVRGGESVLEFESVRRRRNGGLIEVALTLWPIRDGQGRIRGVAQIVRDIRGRKRLERALQSSERLYRDLYEASPAMLHSIDLSDHVLNVSDAWLAQLGYPRGEVLGRPFSDFLAEESKPVARERILPELLRGHPVREIRLRMMKCDASPMDVLLSASLERDETGNPRCALAVLRDAPGAH